MNEKGNGGDCPPNFKNLGKSENFGQQQENIWAKPEFFSGNRKLRAK